MASSTSKPEFILVPGAWHSPDSFKPTTTLLEKAGYTIHGISLPSVGGPPFPPSIAEDAVVITAKLNEVLSSGKDVIMLYHSYGSVPGTEALKSYVEELEKEKGGKGGEVKGKEGWGKVRRLVFCASFILPEKGSLMAALNNTPLPWFVIDNDKVTPHDPQNIFYNDIPPRIATSYISALQPHSYQTFFSQLTVAPWMTIKSTYILCTNDNAIPIQGQEGMLAMAEQAAPGCFDVIERCDAGHSPFISQPKWLAEKLIKAASGTPRGK